MRAHQGMPADTPHPGHRRLRWTIRLRLTLLYGVLFLASGALLLAVTYMLTTHTPPWAEVRPPTPPQPTVAGAALPGPQPPASPADIQSQLAQQRDRDRRQLLVASGIALVGMTVVSVGLGWLTAGRALRPLRTLADNARSISARDLHRRLAAPGPADEIKCLADTFDELLDHLESAFEAQRRFVANASHELRTPLTFERSVLEVALANPDASAADLRHTCQQVLASNQQQGTLIEALLTLARSQRGLDRRTELDLAVLAAAALDTLDPDTTAVRIETDLGAAPILGDPTLIERLVANLVDNAVRHNITDGRVSVRTGVEGRHPTLRICNSGSVISPTQVDGLFEPFQRLQTTRTSGRAGHGVGLSVVAAIAAAHDAKLSALALPDGGLDIRIAFPAHK
ncbi:sensor histidine kinase [Micromonospora sp. CPCC 206061]|uniref:sensor histidine kinase n=1 Tax=Micromonospora sp. CPCC 206061 TaxID=3122410 RepID=UPI002FF410FE